MEDTRNVIDEFKGVPQEQIIAELDARHPDYLEIAVDNVTRDFNMGTIIRTANAFGVRHVHVIGRKQWNKRGAMMTDTYLHVHYHQTAVEFMQAIASKTLVAVDNVEGSRMLGAKELPQNAVLLFGAEGPGIREELLKEATEIVAIEQYGSTRSINVGVAAGIVMYEWVRVHKG
ncbi:MAG TPA: TrmH family RNA methyltransferase [Patescibacteria group bacterium]|nr:TrmH family RNA methyltransferase [Patescibacteria group bacterium]